MIKPYRDYLYLVSLSNTYSCNKDSPSNNPTKRVLDTQILILIVQFY